RHTSSSRDWSSDVCSSDLERRLVLPSTYFTTTPFTNWTRASSDITGTVYVDLDWTVPLDGLRERFEAFLATRDDWDGRGSSVAEVGSAWWRDRAAILAGDL